MGEFIIFGNMSLPYESVWIFPLICEIFWDLSWATYIFTPFSLVPKSFLSPFWGTLCVNGLIILIIKKQVFSLVRLSYWSILALDKIISYHVIFVV